MRTIICPACRSAAVGPPPANEKIKMGRFTGRHPIVVKCFRCTGSFRLSPSEFFRLPEEPEETK